jgi:hypothetical protein
MVPRVGMRALCAVSRECTSVAHGGCRPDMGEPRALTINVPLGDRYAQLRRNGRRFLQESECGLRHRKSADDIDPATPFRQPSGSSRRFDLFQRKRDMRSACLAKQSGALVIPIPGIEKVEHDRVAVLLGADCVYNFKVVQAHEAGIFIACVDGPLRLRRDRGRAQTYKQHGSLKRRLERYDRKTKHIVICGIEQGRACTCHCL